MVNVKTNAFKKLYDPYGSDISKRVVEHHLENGGVSRFEKIKIYHKIFLGEDIDEIKIQNIAHKFSKIVLIFCCKNGTIYFSYLSILHHT